MFISMLKKSIILAILFLVSITAHSQLKNSDIQADYIVIYPEEFQTKIQSFIDWRASTGMKVIAADLNSIYQEFEGEDNSEQIRNFVSYALEYWQKPSPKYLLLAAGMKHIPLKNFKSNFEQLEDMVAFDSYYGENIHDNDGIMDIAVGRFPARSSEQLENMINKTIEYENNLSRIEHNYDFLSWSGYDEYGGFDEITRSYMEKLPTHLKSKQMEVDQNSEHYTTKEEFLTEIRKGTKYLFLLTHGNTHQWGYEELLKSEEIDGIDWGNKAFINLSSACNNNFNDPEKASVVEKLLYQESGGTVLNLGSSGYTYGSIAISLHSFLSQELTNSASLRIGDAFLDYFSELDLGFEEEKPNIKARMTILGDPALSIPTFPTASVENIFDQDVSSLKISPNPCFGSANIHIELRNEEHASIKIISMEGIELISLPNYKLNSGINNFKVDVSQLTSASYLIYMRIKDKVYSSILVVTR